MIKTGCIATVVALVAAASAAGQDITLQWANFVAPNFFASNATNSIGAPDDDNSMIMGRIGQITYSDFSIGGTLDLAALQSIMGAGNLARYDAVAIEFNGSAGSTFESSTVTGADSGASDVADVLLGTGVVSGSNWIAAEATGSEINAAFGGTVNTSLAFAVLLLDFDGVDMFDPSASLTIRGGDGGNGFAGPDPVAVGVISIPAPGVLMPLAGLGLLTRRRR